MSTSQVIPVLRSLPTTAAITDLVRGNYGLDVDECLLVRSFVNEVYEVRTREQRYVLKLYHHGGWSTEEIAWEAELVDHLVANEIPVAKVIPLTAGGQAGEINAPEGVRPFLLSEFVEVVNPSSRSMINSIVTTAASWHACMPLATPSPPRAIAVHSASRRCWTNPCSSCVRPWPMTVSPSDWSRTWLPGHDND